MDQEGAYSQVTDYHITTSIIHLFYKKQNGWSVAQELVNSAVEKPKPSSRTGKKYLSLCSAKEWTEDNHTLCLWAKTAVSLSSVFLFCQQKTQFFFPFCKMLWAPGYQAL